MASPHVAGAVAVLWSAAPGLIGDIDRTEAILRASATPIPYDECGPTTGADGLGNNGYGAGHLNLLSAVHMALESDPILAVTVINAAGQTIPNIDVSVLQLSSQEEFTATTTASGIALFSAIPAPSWVGVRHITFLMDVGERPLIVIDAPVNLAFPFIPCNADLCRAVAETLPFVLKPTH
jgi:hypothetical protein